MPAKAPSTRLTPLVARAVAGDAQAFGDLLNRFQDMAVGYAYSILGDRQAAEDVAQEAFIAAWQLLPQLREPEAFPGWLRSIVFKYCDRVRRRKLPAFVALENIEDESAPSDNPAASAEVQELRAALFTAVRALPEKEREVLTLFYFAGRSQAAIAGFLGLPESTIKSRLFSARKKLRQRMLPLMEESGTALRPSRNGDFSRRVMKMIRPTDRELDDSGGAQGCAGGAIWEMMCAAVTGDVPAIRALLAQNELLAQAQFWYTPPLHYAVREGHLEAVKILVEAGADPTFIRYGGEDLKIVAADRGQHAVAEYIAAAQNQRLGGAMADHEIHDAVTRGDAVRIAALLEAQPELVNLPDAKGRNPLHLATADGNHGVARLLIEAGANLEAQTGANNTYLPACFTPLDFAVWGNDWWISPKKDWEMADLLIGAGAEYSISIAAARGDAARVEKLLAQDLKQANAARPCGRRPLSSAVQFGHIDLATRLLEAGADPNLHEGRYVKTGCALYFALRDKHHAMAELLLSHGARTDSSIDSCGMAYHVADEAGRILLYRYGLVPSEVDVQNVDALAVWASKDPEGLARTGCGTVFTMIVKNEWFDETIAMFTDEKKEAILRMLLAMGVKVPPVVTGCAGYLWHKPKLTRILLEHGMDPGLPNWQLVTPLHSLCSVNARGQADANRVELAGLFLEFGADINARDEEYRSTPLGWAARCGLMDMAELLLQRGAAVQLPDDESWATPLAWADRRGHADIAALLIKHGAKR